MTQAIIQGQPVQYPDPGMYLVSTSMGYQSDIIDASTEKFAWSGYISGKPYTGTKNISKVHCRLGTVASFNALSVLRLSLQDIITTAGPPAQPDGTQDQFGDLSAGITSGAFVAFTLGAARTVSYGDKLSCVLEYQTFTAADSVALANAMPGNLRAPGLTALFTGTWGARNGAPCVLLEYDDGTFGTLLGGLPSIARATSSGAYNTGTALTEAGLRLQLPTPKTVVGAWFIVNAGATADFDVHLRLASDHVSKASGSFDAHTQVAASSTRIADVWFTTPYVMPINTDHDLVVVPTTTNSLNIVYDEVAAAAHLQAWPFGELWHYVTKTSGVWAATLTRRPMCGLWIAGGDDGAGGGGTTAPMGMQPIMTGF